MRIVLKDFEEVLKVLGELIATLTGAISFYILCRDNLKKTKRKAAVSRKKRRSRYPKKNH